MTKITVVYNNHPVDDSFENITSYGFLDGGYLDVATRDNDTRVHNIINLNRIEKIEIKD